METDFRVLVVEDEVLISMLIEDMLADIGCKCVDVAPSVEVALEALTKEQPHFAMLDVNLNGKRSFPIADILKTRAIPFIFLSGYGSGGPGRGISRRQSPAKAISLGRSRNGAEGYVWLHRQAAMTRRLSLHLRFGGSILYLWRRH